MYVHMSNHYPREGKEGELVESMHRFGEAMKHQPGLRQAHTLKDDSSNRLIGLAIWFMLPETQEGDESSTHHHVLVLVASGAAAFVIAILLTLMQES